MKNNQQYGLGKGLAALLGDAAQEADSIRKPVDYINKEVARTVPAEQAPSADIVRIPADLIKPNPYQPRMHFDEEALSELAESIRTLGLIQPITVRRVADRQYQIISGERRFRACRACGMELIPAYVRDASEQGMLEMAIVENIQRENLDPIEVALSYRRLIEECHLTQEQMASRVSKKRSSIANSLRLLSLPVKIQHDIKAGLLSVGHAKVLLGVTDPLLQEELSDIVIGRGLSVRQLEDRIKRLSAPPKAEEEAILPDDYHRVLEHLGRWFPGDVTLRRTSTGRGTMTVHFSSDTEMASFLEALDSISD